VVSRQGILDGECVGCVFEMDLEVIDVVGER
jgi:hypothetical protein